MIRFEGMDDTNLSPRQRKILEFLGQKALTRKVIADFLKTFYPASRVTVIRDLGSLVKKGLIKTEGKGRQTKYRTAQENPLLAYINLEDYFSREADKRVVAYNRFNFGVYRHLESLFSRQEKQWFKSFSKSLSQQQKKLDPTIFRREIERFMVEFSWKSSRIEGNTYTLLETEILLKQMKEAAGHPKYEAIMILNHKNALDYISKRKERFKKLTLKEIVRLHELLTQDLKITSGIRKHKVAISGTSYIPLSDTAKIKKALNRLVLAVNRTSDPLEKALIAAVMLAYIQPFNDGNKRTARTLANAILLTHDLYPLSYRNVEEVEYLQALILFYEQNNLYHFKRIFLEQFKYAVKNYFLL